MNADRNQTFSNAALALDEAALNRLLALAGPEDGPELMRRLIVDLDAVAVGLAASLATGDRGGLRHHSHVLLAISGSIGARRLCDLAQMINQSAKDDTMVAQRSQADEIMWRLDAVILRLRDMQADQGSGG